MENPALVILPLLSLVLASLSVAAIWYWWVSTSGDKSEEEEQDAAEDEQADPTVGDLVGRIGGFTDSLFSASRDKPAEKQAQARHAPDPAPRGSWSGAADGEAVEVMRVLRDLATGSLIVEIDGQRYHRLSQIADPQIKRRLVGNAGDLQNFVQLSQPVGSIPEPPVSEAPAETATPLPPTSAEPAVKGAEEPELKPIRSMAEEIEELLQYRLMMTPDLATHTIHIHEAPGGGVKIEVDGHYFDGVNEVADPQIQSFIQRVIREWEARQ